MRKIMKISKFIKIITIFAGLLYFLSCSNVVEDTASPLFSDVEPMNANATGPKTVSFTNVPSNAKYLIIFISSSAFDVDENNRIINDTIVGGNRTGLDGITRNGTTELHTYSVADGDFTNDNGYSFINDHYWVVWGLDKYLNVVCSTPRYQY